MNALNPIQLYEVAAVYMFKGILLLLYGYQVSKGKSGEFLANLEKNLANFSDFGGAN